MPFDSSAYITPRLLQKTAKEMYKASGFMPVFLDVADKLYKNGGLLSKPSLVPHFQSLYTDDDFCELSLDMPVKAPILDRENGPAVVQENSLVPKNRDVNFMRSIAYIGRPPHKHDHFEFSYVYRGQCLHKFQEHELVLREGQLFLLAPESIHTKVFSEDDVVFSSSIRSSTFLTMFWSLMAQNDPLAKFFQRAMQSPRQDNALLFTMEVDDELRYIIQKLLLECSQDDAYSNHCAISLINQLFIKAVRQSSKAENSILLFGNMENNCIDTGMLLEHLQQNYQSVTLSSLAERFHYSEPHICKLFQQQYGTKFSNMIRGIKLSHAKEYLSNTNIKIADISGMVGYDSADHFSRLFKQTFGCTPSAYRQSFQKQNN